jgi:hypothetical protein
MVEEVPAGLSWVSWAAMVDVALCREPKKMSLMHPSRYLKFSLTDFKNRSKRPPRPEDERSEDEGNSTLLCARCIAQGGTGETGSRRAGSCPHRG